MCLTCMYNKWGGAVPHASNATRIGDLKLFRLLAAAPTDSPCGVTHTNHENQGVVVQNYCLEFYGFPEFLVGGFRFLS